MSEQRIKESSFPALLEMHKNQIALALPKHLNADRMARIALTCFRMTPKLADCEPMSVFAAVIQASQLGLEPGLNGRAYLIPYGNQAQFVPGWKGLVELANRSGRASVWTGVIYEGQKFTYMQGDSPKLTDIGMSDEDDPAKIAYAYAIGRVRGSDWPIIELWSTEKIRKHRDRYNKVGKRHYSFEQWEMYARKVPLLQVLKYLPASIELETAMALSYAADAGSQGLTIKDAIDGSWMPAPSEERSTGTNGDGERTESGRKKPREKAAAHPVPEVPENFRREAPPPPPPPNRLMVDENGTILAQAHPDEIFNIGDTVKVGIVRYKVIEATNTSIVLRLITMPPVATNAATLPPDDYATPKQIAQISGKATAYEITEKEICKAFKVANLRELPGRFVPAVLRWLENPADDPHELPPSDL